MRKLLAAALAAALAVGLCVSAPAQGGPPGMISPDAGVKRADADCFTLEGALTDYADGSVLDMRDYCLYTQKSGDMAVRLQLGGKQRLRVRVLEGKVSALLKREKNDAYRLTIHPEYEAQDMAPEDWQVELDAGERAYVLRGRGAYSDVQAVSPGDRLTVRDSALGADDGQSGFVFDFNGPLEEAAYIRCTPAVEVCFNGDYGTDRENLRVETDIIEEVADFFGDVRIDCYDFIGAPRFESEVTVMIAAGRGSALYQYNRKTGDLTRMSADYDASGWRFSTRSLGTYIIAEEEYGIEKGMAEN